MSSPHHEVAPEDVNNTDDDDGISTSSDNSGSNKRHHRQEDFDTAVENETADDTSTAAESQNSTKKARQPRKKRQRVVGVARTRRQQSAERDAINTAESETESQNATNKVIRRTFEDSLLALLAFKEEHGHCRVPKQYKPDPKLGNFVQQMRKKQEILPKEKYEKLDEIGFHWERDTRKAYARFLKPMDPTQPLENQRAVNIHQWNKQFAKLKHFYVMNGHSRVTTTGEPKLYSWSEHQRRYFAMGAMPDDLKAKLDSIEFPFVARDPKRIGQLYEKQWHSRYNELVEFQKIYNTVDVKNINDGDGAYQDLEKWVEHQHVLFKRKELREERKILLEQIGVTFEKITSHLNMWHQRYKELKAFKEEHGHLNVGTKKETYALYRWVKFQRERLGTGRMNPTEKGLLDDLGFVWERVTKKDSKKADNNSNIEESDSGQAVTVENDGINKNSSKTPEVDEGEGGFESQLYPIFKDFCKTVDEHLTGNPEKKTILLREAKFIFDSLTLRMKEEPDSQEVAWL